MSLCASPPILSCAAAGAWEKKLLTTEAAEWDAMQRAGAAIAAALLEDFREIGGLPAAARLLILAGKGHNGGDALLAAEAVLKKYPAATADLLLAFSAAPLKPLAQRSHEVLEQVAGARLRHVTLSQLKAELASYDVCLDGVFGFQFHPPIDDTTAEILAWVNTHPRIKLRAAVDLPSGLGECNAGTVFRADFTYATGVVKAPVLAPDNATWVGRVRYLDLGLFAVERVDPNALGRVLLLSILRPLAQLRPAQSDKRTNGHLFVVGGSRNYPGAVLMTVQAALRSGVGLLTAFVPASLVPEYAARFPEAMWVAWPETPTGGLSLAGVKLLLEKLPRASALVTGPGLGAEAETLAAVKEMVSAATVPMLVDADALRPEILVAANGKRLIATPHAGELQRIASEAGWREHGVLVAKGYPTHVSSLPPTGGETYHSLFGGPVLARGGSGDILAGLIGGLLAQGPDDLLLAAGRGVVWHGLAADLLARDKGQVAVQTTQLLNYLQPALASAL